MHNKGRMFTSIVLGRLTWIGVGLGILWWILEAAIDVWVFHSGDFGRRLFAPSHVVVSRLLVLCTLTALGAYLQVLDFRRTQAEETLRQERDIAQKYLHIAGVLIIALDADGIITLANRKACEVLGYQEAELVGRNWFDTCLPQRIRGEMRAVFDRLVAGEVEPAEYFENPVLTKSGEERLISWHNAVLLDESGRVMGTLSSGEDITARQRMEEALGKSEERFRKQFEEALDAIFVADAQTGILVDCNRAACELVGREKSELIGRHQRDLHPPEETVGEFSRAFEQHLREEGKVLEAQVITKSGEIKDVAIKASLFEVGGQKVLQGIFRDITERKRAERALEQRATQLALINDIGGQIAAVMDLDGVLERAARLVQEKFGYHHAALFTVDRERGELVMRARSGKFAHLFPLDHRLRLGQGMVGWVGQHGETLLANDVDAEPRYVNLYPDIVPTKAELSVPIRVGKEIVGVLDVQSDQPNAFSENDVMVIETLADQIAIAIENARLYEAVQKIGESERRFREQLSVLQEVSIELSKVPTFDDLCRQAIELGRSRLGFDRLGIWFIDENDPQSMIGSFGTDEGGQLRDERGRRLSIALEQANERIFTGQTPLVLEPDTPLRDDTGAVIGRGWEALVALWDGAKVIGSLSADNLLQRQPLEQHQLEILRLYGVTLGHLCTRKRAEEALAQKAQELARSNADLEHFAYVASHDLQEPLRMVTSYLQLLERRYKDRLDADARDFIAYAVDGATRMQALINGLLSYSRVSTRGKSFEPTDGTVALERVLANLKVAIEESDAVVTYDHLPTVMADEVQLTQVFQNLIGNAIKFRSDRRPEIHVGAEYRGGEWLFSVRDNGIGIDPQHFERIFKIFQRLHSHEEYPGTGIGLAVCKKIVERHGGRIWVESQPGEGTTFYFTIPERGSA